MVLSVKQEGRNLQATITERDQEIVSLKRQLEERPQSGGSQGSSRQRRRANERGESTQDDPEEEEGEEGEDDSAAPAKRGTLPTDPQL
jgi:hypothetical protein